MAETPKPAVPPVTVETPAQVVTKLKALGNEWCAQVSGKANFNPHLEVARRIMPIINALVVKDAKVTDEIKAKVAAFPKTCPCINTDYVPPVKEKAGLPRATAESVGEKNARE